jgi:hypothetical protein
MKGEPQGNSACSFAAATRAASPTGKGSVRAVGRLACMQPPLVISRPMGKPMRSIKRVAGNVGTLLSC